MKDEATDGYPMEHHNANYREAYKRGAKLEHEGWYGCPIKRPPSVRYRENYDEIRWDK